MNRKFIYGLLALPVLLALIALALAPSETRATFFTEFKHRTRLMMGYEPQKYSDEQGLRSEHPEEYGLMPEDESGEAESEAEEGSDELEAESDETADDSADVTAPTDPDPSS